MTTHTYPMLRSKKCGAVSPRPYTPWRLVHLTVASGWGTDSSWHCLSILLNGPRKTKIMTLYLRTYIQSTELQNIVRRSQLHSVGNIAPPAIQWQIILHHNVIGFHSNALEWRDPIYKSHVSLQTKQPNSEDQHHIETCHNLMRHCACRRLSLKSRRRNKSWLHVPEINSLNDDHPLPGIMIILSVTFTEHKPFPNTSVRFCAEPRTRSDPLQVASSSITLTWVINKVNNSTEEGRPSAVSLTVIHSN
jgi:hypothetical protein